MLISQFLVDLRKFLRDTNDDGTPFPTSKDQDIDLWDAFLAHGVFVNPGTYILPCCWRAITLDLTCLRLARFQIWW
jgi:hypothetical protein